jgi:hypothetical protein
VHSIPCQQQSDSLTFNQGLQRKDKIQAKPLPLATVREVSPNIDLSVDCQDLHATHLNLEELEALNEKVQRNPFVGHIIWGALPPGEKAHKLRNKIEQQVIKNNQAYKRYPTDFIHSLLSLHVYQDVKPNTPVTFTEPDYQDYAQYLSQWRVNTVHDLPEFGRYYAVSYNNDEARQLVLAHRGTTATWKDCLNTDSPIKTDLIGVLAGEIVAQQKAEYGVTKSVAEYAKANHYHFSTTGHSLGAWLAEISVYYSVFEFKQPSKAVTFDSPGSIKMESFHRNILNHDNARDIKNLEIVTYLSDPNFVNTCNRHIGQVYRLYPDYEKDLPPISKKILPNYKAVWSLWGHALVPFLKEFDPVTGQPPQADLMTRWPVITYTPRENVRQNILTPIRNTLTAVLGKKIIGPAYQDINQQRTITSFLNLVGDVWAGRFDQRQYLKCWELLQACPAENASVTEKIGYQFSLTYEASYEPTVKDPSTGKLIISYKGSVDWYLKKLHDCPVDKIAQHFGPDHLITQQLTLLKTQYHIEEVQGNYRLTATQALTVEEIKEWIFRLMEEHVTQGQVKAFLKTHVHTPLLTAPSLKLTSNLLPLFPSLAERYIARTEDFVRIDQLLAIHPYIVIKGEPGFGKTSLANEYAHRQKNRPHHAKLAIKIDADSQEKIINAYQTMARSLNIASEQCSAEELMRLVHHKIALSQKSVLLIFDNAEDAAYMMPYINYLPQGAKAIITTRHSRLIEGAPSLQARPFSCQEAAQYIFASAIKDRIHHPEEVQALVNYYAKGTNAVLPYHLNRAIGIIKQKPTGGINQYLAFVKAHPADEGELILQQKRMATSKLAWPILQYAAYLDPDFIDLSIFTELFKVTEEELTEAIAILESLSAMTVVRKSGQEGLTLHRLTQAIVREFIENPLHQETCVPATERLLSLAQSLNTLCPYVDNNPDQKWQQANNVMPHIEMILHHLPSELVNPVIAELFNKVGKYATEVSRQYAKALAAQQEGLTIWQKCYPDQPHPGVASALCSLGYNYKQLGGQENMIKSLQLQEQALAMYQALYGDQPHPNVANSFNNLGKAYERLGGQENTSKGLQLHEQALVMRQTLYPDQPHPDVASSLNNLGKAYGRLGGQKNRIKGLQLQAQALRMLQALYSDQSHPDVAESLHDLGEAYVRLGGQENTRKGLQLQAQALAMYQALYPDQPHPDVAETLNDLGFSYQQLGGQENSRKGLQLLEQALAMYQTLYLDQPHPNVSTLLNNVGSTYKQLGGQENRRKGLQLQEQALAMHQTLYPDQPHPEMAALLNNVGYSYAQLDGRENEGLQLQEQALVMVQALYGDQPHPEVAVSLNNVGMAYTKLGGKENLLKGLQLQKQALAIHQALYPDQPHPEVALFLSNTGIAYKDLGGKENLQRGLQLQEQALAMYRTLYSDQPHPDVANSLSNVGIMYENLGGKENLQKGSQLQEQALAMRQALSLDQTDP